MDGLDEVADPTTGAALRDALFEGMRRYPHARWLLTSRIVGYDTLPFHCLAIPTDDGPGPDGQDTQGCTPTAAGPFAEFPERRARAEPEPPIAEVWYLAPFRMRQIQGFAHAWYALHEGDPARRKASADDLAGRIAASGSLLRLARSPVLLTLMALIHRIKAGLPDGRALLYERLAEAYLESIDQERGIRQVGFRLAQQKRWLAWIGYRMQLQCTADARSAGPEFPVLAHRSVVLQWLNESMEREHPPIEGTGEAEHFLTYLGRRTGLFLPRGTEQYAFQDRSLQEYFAACHLLEQITSPEWLLGEATADETTPTLERLREWTGDPRWHEVFVLLFELLQDRSRWGDRLAKQLFGPALEDPTAWAHRGPVPDAVALLAAEISVDEQSGISLDVRRQCWRSCWCWCSSTTNLRHNPVGRRLTGAGPRWQPEVWRTLGEIAPASLNLSDLTDLQPLTGLTNLATLDLSGCAGLTDLQPLAGLTNLRVLNLWGCTGVTDLQPLTGLRNLQSLVLWGFTRVTDLQPLATLTRLESLGLRDCPGVTDLQPLAGLTNLQRLNLYGCTGVTDLQPLAGLVRLGSLDLWGCSGVTGLRPLAGLANLCVLGLSDCTGVTELQPLAGLTNLRSLTLKFPTGVIDLWPLAGLTNLEELGLGGSTGLTDVEFLAGLANLQFLNLPGCTGVTDLQPLAGLKNLELLSLRGCTGVTDLQPLAGLTNLRYLDMGRCTGVTDLQPLARLTNLRDLDLGECTGVTDLQPLAGLVGLRSLRLSHSPQVEEMVRALPETLQRVVTYS